MTQPLSLRLPEGIRFFPHPLPAVPSATSLRRAYLGRRTTGLPRSTDESWMVRLCLSAGGSDSDDRGRETPLYLATYLLVQASQRLWLAGSHDVYQQFT